jgi:hypothetical protein
VGPGSRRSFAVVIVTIDKAVVIIIFAVTTLCLVSQTVWCALAVTVSTVYFFVVVVVLAVTALEAGLGLLTVSCFVNLAVVVIAVHHAIPVVVLMVRTLLTGLCSRRWRRWALMRDTRVAAAAVGDVSFAALSTHIASLGRVALVLLSSPCLAFALSPHGWVPETIWVHAVIPSIPVVVSSIKALPSCLGMGTPGVSGRAGRFAVWVIAVGEAVEVVILIVEALRAGLVFQTVFSMDALTVVAIDAAVAIVVHVILTLSTCFGVGAAIRSSRLALAVKVVTVDLAVVVVVLAVETLVASLSHPVLQLAILPHARILQTVGVLAIGPAISVIITVVHAFAASLSVGTVVCGEGAGLAAPVIAVDLPVAIVVLMVGTLGNANFLILAVLSFRALAIFAVLLAVAIVVLAVAALIPGLAACTPSGCEGVCLAAPIIAVDLPVAIVVNWHAAPAVFSLSVRPLHILRRFPFYRTHLHRSIS